MIKLSPATTDKENTMVNSKLMCRKALVFSICYFGLGSGGGHQSNDQSKNIINTGFQFASAAVLLAPNTLPIVLASGVWSLESGVPCISGLALAKDLTSPKYGNVFIFGSLLYAIALTLGKPKRQPKRESVNAFINT